MIWSLQTLRFVAALMVVCIHSAQAALMATGSTGLIPHQLAGLGLSGVDIFFVLSGVVIAKSAVGKSAGQFAWKRGRRILPVYFLCCLPALAVSAESGIGWRDLLASFLLWPATDVMTAPLLQVAWTLCFEMLFYLGAALVVADRRWAYVLVMLYGLALTLRSFGPVFQFVGNPIIIEFLFGIGLAHAPRWRGGVVALPIGFAALIASGVLGVAPAGDTLDFLLGKDAFNRVALFGVPAAMITYGAMQIDARESIWTYLGGASYSLYLTHTFVVTGLLAIWMRIPAPPEVIILVGICASLAFAWRVHERLERPILRALPTDPRRAIPRRQLS